MSNGTQERRKTQGFVEVFGILISGRVTGRFSGRFGGIQAVSARASENDRERDGLP
jgi:hypothetical protein